MANSSNNHTSNKHFKINGFDTSKEIRKVNSNTPNNCLGHFSKEEAWKEITKSGINNIATKPFEAKKLIELIQETYFVTICRQQQS